MNDFQNLNKKRSKLSLYRNYKSNTKPKNMPQGLKSILITNSNGLEISSQFGNFLQFSKKNMLDENFSFKRITTNYNKNNNKNTSFPINTASNMKNIKTREGPIVNLKSNLFKKKFEKFLTNSKKNESSKNHNLKERTNSNINIMNNITGLMLNRSNMKLNIIPKKSSLKYVHYKENNLSVNSYKNIGKSTSKSKSKSKNKRENKSYNDNLARMFFNKYLKLKFDRIGYRKKSHKKSFGYLNKESPRPINNKLSNEINISDINKINSFNLIKNIQFKGIRKKNKSSNLLISNMNNVNNINNINTKPKNVHNSRTNSNNIIISKIETNKIYIKNNKAGNKNNLGLNNNINNIKINQNNDKNGKKYLTENHIMYIVNKKNSGKNKNQKMPLANNKIKQISFKEIKNESNVNTNINSKNNNSNNYININKHNNINNNNIINNKPKIETNENVIYDYKTNKKFQNNTNNIFKDNKNKIVFYKKDNKLINNTNTNPNVNEIENSTNTYKILNERLKTEYNDISLEAIDKMYEQDTYDLNNNNKNIRSKKNSEDNSFRFFYPDGDIYNRDDEFFIENNDENFENNENNEKREKELDETESPLKMDTDKVTVENSGVLSFDQVKDIICYYNMNNTDKQSEFLFQNKEREIFDMNHKNKYLNFFFGNKENETGSYFGLSNENNNNELMDDMISINTFNLKYPNNSIFSLDTEYSSKMKKKYNKNLLKNI